MGIGGAKSEELEIKTRFKQRRQPELITTYYISGPIKKKSSKERQHFGLGIGTCDWCTLRH
jgi:hypothetical protein